jgi:5'-phosphate synthase pdxT subunit
MKRVGVLALQGDFDAHRKALESAGADVVLVRSAAQLEPLDGLVIPGGESTTMLKLLRAENMIDSLCAFGRRRPMFGTCAGAILLAREVHNPVQDSLGVMDIAVERNAYGRQIDSRVARIAPEPGFAPLPPGDDIEAVFIRAPVIRRLGPGVSVLARYHGDPVLVRQGPHLVATFHPELSDDRRVHRWFVEGL